MNRWIIIGAGLVIGVIACGILLLPWAHSAPQAEEQAPGLTLMTDTPEEGFDLAIALARKGVTETQPDTEVLHELRGIYADDADSLIAASHVVAVHFQTVAAANDYWRDR